MPKAAVFLYIHSMSQLFPSVAWSHQANIYEVNIRQYTKEGSFEAFAKHLPRLKAMGIDILWFMPITPISKKVRQGTLGSYYACSSYTQINDEFGSLASFQSLVKQAHDLGLKVIIDWVANHTGWDHEWTITNPGYYKRNTQGEFFDANGWHDVIDLDYNNSALQEAMIQAMQYWITTCDIDGFRCDMAHLVPLDFWKKARTAIEATKHCYWLAETDVHSYFDVFDTLYGWEWMHASEKIVKGAFSLQHYNSLLHYYKTQGSAGAKLLFTTNHDENSWNGTEFEKYGQYAPAMAVFATLFPGNALVYSGQEIPNKKRLAFFDKDELLWPTAPTKMQEWYTNFLHFKHLLAKHFIPDDVHILDVYLEKNVLVFTYTSTQNHVCVLLNFSSSAATVAVPGCKVNMPYKSLQSGLAYNFQATESFTLDAAEFAVYHTL